MDQHEHTLYRERGVDRGLVTVTLTTHRLTVSLLGFVFFSARRDQITQVMVTKGILTSDVFVGYFDASDIYRHTTWSTRNAAAWKQAFGVSALPWSEQ